MFRSLPGYLALVSTVLLGAACQNASPTNQNQANDQPNDPAVIQIQVELDIFSGRPNPTWELSAAERAVFLNMFSQCTPTPPRTLHDGLGYRGFRLTMTNGATGERTVLAVQGGVVQVDQDGTIRFCEDPERTMEPWLIGSSRPHIDAALYHSLKTDS